jgi:hypothetical protein
MRGLLEVMAPTPAGAGAVRIGPNLAARPAGVGAVPNIGAAVCVVEQTRGVHRPRREPDADTGAMKRSCLVASRCTPSRRFP